MTNFYPDHVLIDGQAAAAGYSISKKTQVITVFMDLPTGEKSKVKIPVEYELYPEVYALHLSIYNHIQKDEPPDFSGGSGGELGI